MKRSKSHNVYLSSQALDIFIAFESCSVNSRYVLPFRYDAGAPMLRSNFNRITALSAENARKEGSPLAPLAFITSDGPPQHYSMKWASTVTEWKNVLRMETAALHSKLVIKPNFNIRENI